MVCLALDGYAAPQLALVHRMHIYQRQPLENCLGMESSVLGNELESIYRRYVLTVNTPVLYPALSVAWQVVAINGMM